MKYYKSDEKKIHFLGRTSNQFPKAIFWTAGGFEVITNSSEFWIDIEVDCNEKDIWARIEIDGFCMQRLLLQKGRYKLCAFRNFNEANIRNIKFLRENQPMQEDETQFLLIHGIECDGELYEIPKKKMNIEFIGDSLSSGEGLGGAVSLKQAGAAVYGLSGHYAITTAQNLDADFRIMSQSGWGVHCSCFNDYIRIMPKYYEQVCGVLVGETNRRLGAFDKHNFDEWQPDVVVINLGSNDGFALDREAWMNPETGTSHRQITNTYGGVEKNSAIRFEKSVIEFIKKVRKYNPNAFIIWAYGMCEHIMSPYLNKAVSEYITETNDERVMYQLLPATNELWVGSSNHPGIKTHALAAEVLTDTIKRVLNNK